MIDAPEAPPAAGRPRVPSEDDEAEQHLAILQHGSREQKIAARFALARIFERRGLLDEAAELYERNVLVGVRERGLYERLAAVYRRRGEQDLADEVLREAARLPASHDPTPPRPPSAPEGTPREVPVYARVEPVLGLAGAGPSAGLSGAVRQAALLGGAALLVFVAAATLVVTEPWTLLPPRLPAAPPLAGVLPPAESASKPVERTSLPVLAALRDRIGPRRVGAFLEDAQVDEAGNARQRTELGELTWRRDTGLATFSDGQQTWIETSRGLQRRLVQERFAWEEALPTGGGAISTTAATTAADYAFMSPTALVRKDSLLPATRIVTYYGNPLSPLMGVLGQDEPDVMVARLKQQAQAFAAADPSRPVQPALSLITPTAQHSPGNDGLYRLRMTPQLIEEVAGWAERNNLLLFLDVQVGRSTVEAELQPLLPYLKRPYVHLALDPEFAMQPDQVPGEVIGSLDARDINYASRLLADLVAAERLPPKVLVVHRFLGEMVTNSRDIRLDPRVQVVINMDGFGSKEAKVSKYDWLVGEQQVQYAGLKGFYEHDAPLMTVREMLDLTPSPDFIMYQ